MKIAVIEPVGGHGGMDYYDYGLASGLGLNNVNVLFFTCDKTQKRAYENVETFLLFRNLWSGNLISKSIKYLFGHLKAFGISKKKDAKIIHLHFFFFRGIDLIVLLLSKFFRLKAVVTIHDVSSFHNKSNSFVEKNCYRLMNGVIVHNFVSFNMVKSKIKEQKPISITPHGNYLPFIEPVNANRNTKTCFNVLFFGQIKEVKGLDLLLQAIALIVKRGFTKVKLVIKGRAYKNDLSNYERLIYSLGISEYVECDFRYIPDDEVTKAYQDADLVILPYREIYQSGVLLLSMSYGRPVLCSDLLPFKEVVEDGISGLLFKSENINDLADKIQFCIENPEKLDKISCKANEIIREKFDWRNIGLKTKHFYEKILKNNPTN